MPAKNLIGKKFGRLLVLSREGSNNRRQATWNCLCDCGKEYIVSTNALTTGNTTSCGCYVLEKVTKHGFSNHPLFNIWKQMKARCYNKNNESYHNYGKRNIRVSKSWYHSFEQFVEDMGERPSKYHSIERIDNDKGYCKSNCRWATAKEQAHNRRQNVFLTYKGETLTMSQWAKRTGIPFKRIQQRNANGWPVHRVLDKKLWVNQHC
jgi:hypothetical protein